MSYACNGTRSSSLALAVSQARAIVLAGAGPALIEDGDPCGVLIWRRDDEWRVRLVDMLPTPDRLEFKQKVEQLLLDHG